MRPFFSIIIPTRNRAKLLSHALASAVEQDFNDYEIVVSDNNSSDETREVVERAKLSPRRIKYLNPGIDLSMCDNWENVLLQAEGKYILLLCDDDVLPRISLSYIHRIVENFQPNVLAWRSGSYVFADYPEEKERLKFTYPYGSGKVFMVSSKPVMDALLRFDWSVNGIVPKMLNAVVSRAAIDVCRQRTANFFLPPYPDFSATGQLLATNEYYYFVDLPMYVSGASGLSNAAFVMKRKQVFDDYLSLYGRDLLEGVRYPMPYLCTSYFSAGWRLLGQTYPDVFTGEIDMAAYLRALFKELTLFEDYEDVSGEFAQVAAYMRELSGSDEMFEELRSNWLKTKTSNLTTENGGLGAIKRRAWALLRNHERLYRVLSSARGRQVAEASFTRVPTVDAASRLLEKYLQKHLQRMNYQKSIPVNSINFLAEYADA